MNHPSLAFSQEIYPSHITVTHEQEIFVYLTVTIWDYCEFNVILETPSQRDVFFGSKNGLTRKLVFEFSANLLQQFDLGIPKDIRFKCVFFGQEVYKYDFILNANSEINNYLSPDIAMILVKFEEIQPIIA